jgi:hypothetical protein
MADRKPYDCNELPPYARSLASCRDFSPSYVEDSRSTYKKRVVKCKALVSDPPEFHAAGCKRGAHVRIPKGRLSFLRPGSYRPVDPAKWQEKEPYTRHEVTEATDKRWAEDLPPFSARTQSPKLRRNPRPAPGSDQEAELTAQITQGLKRYVQMSGQSRRFSVDFPIDPAMLIEAGVPVAAAKLLSRRLGHVKFIPKRQTRNQDLDIRSRINATFGLSELIFAGPDGGKPYFNMDSADLRTLRGALRDPALGFAPFLKVYKDRAAVVERQRRKRKGPRPGRFEGLLPVQDIAWQAEGASAPRSLLGADEGSFLDALNAIFDPKNPFKTPGFLIFTLGRPGRTAVVRLQHSMLASPVGWGPTANYTTLRGLSLDELPPVLARKVLSPRRSRSGRQAASRALSHTSTRKNPMARRKKTRRNPGYPIYHEEALSNEPTLNRVTDYYYPGTIWDYYDEGTLDGNHSVAMPVNRRNPRKSRFKQIEGQRYHANAVHGGSSRNQLISQLAKGQDKETRKRIFGMKTAQLQAMASGAQANPRRSRGWKTVEGENYHPTAVHRRTGPGSAEFYKKSGERGAAAMKMKHQYGITLKEAWGHVKAGTTPTANANPRSRRRTRDPIGYSAGEFHAPHSAKRRPYWPRHSEYEDVQGPYGSAVSPIPVNRRNPNYGGLHPDASPVIRGGSGTHSVGPSINNPVGRGQMIGRFPSPCKRCGQSMKGHPIVQVGRGPRGGKQMAHVNCAGRR